MADVATIEAKRKGGPKRPYTVNANGDKVCTRCGGTSFYEYTKGKCTCFRCRQCNRAKTKTWKQTNAEKVRPRHRIVSANYRERHYDRVRARWTAGNALLRGEIARCPCVECGAPGEHMHHDDYAKPLDVKWFCKQCHERLHGLERLHTSAA